MVGAKAAKAKGPFHMNEAFNGLPLDPAIHIEGMAHAAYNTRVELRLQAFETQLGANVNPEVAKAAINSLIANIKAAIAAHPGVNLNNIPF